MKGNTRKKTPAKQPSTNAEKQQPGKTPKEQGRGSRKAS